MKHIVIGNEEKLKYGRREAINSLKTNLRFTGTDIKVIEFTSCLPNEGKSTTSFDVARAFASSGDRVLLIDTDMRKSALIKRLRIDNGGNEVKGLSHYLSGQSTVNEVICETNIKNLFLVLAGPYAPNPTELLDGERFEKLLETARKRFDIVIIDTPPLGTVIDAAIIAPKCDGTVLLLEPGSTSVKMAVDVVKQLEMTGCKILGCVMNKMTNTSNSYSYKYRYRYKYYGGRPQKGAKNFLEESLNKLKQGVNKSE